MSATRITLNVRSARSDDGPGLADLINAIIARGGTTALEQPFTAAGLDRAYLTGPDVICCFVATEPGSGDHLGFQTLGADPRLPEGYGDIGTFARVDGARRGGGRALFAATCAEARRLGLIGVNATIRADNAGGLRFYGRMGFVDHAVRAAVPLADGTPVDRIEKCYLL